MTDAGRVRLDRWLWAARFFKTRALAAQAVRAGQVLVNDDRPKRAKPLGPGDHVRIRRGPFEFLVTVVQLSEHRGPPAAAQALYLEDPEGKRRRELLAAQLRLAPTPRYAGKGRPTKRQRRDIDRWEGQ